MLQLYRSAFLESLGWSLVDSMWKMALAWLVYLLLTGIIRFRSASRFAMAAMLLTAGTLWSVYGMYQHCSDPYSSSAPLFFDLIQPRLQAFLSLVLPTTALVYLVLLLLFSGKMIWHAGPGQTSLRQCTQAPDSQLFELVERLRQSIGIRRPVRLLLSASTVVPMTIGVLKPVVLLPMAALNQLTVSELETVIAHELFHIRRHDYLINLWLACCGLVLFFNPFSRLFLQAIDKEREHACDDNVMGLGLSAWCYAHALFTVGRLEAATPRLAMASMGEKRYLLERVRRIVQTNNAPERTSTRRVIKTMAGFFLCLCVSLLPGHETPTSLQTDTLRSPTAIVEVFRTIPVRFGTNVTDEPVALIIAATPKLIGQTVHQTKRVKAVIAVRDYHPTLIIRMPAPNMPPVPPLSATAAVDVNRYVSLVKQEAEYTLNVPETSLPPGAKTEISTTEPYIPSATFYHAGVERSLSPSGKVIIHL